MRNMWKKVLMVLVGVGCLFLNIGEVRAEEVRDERLKGVVEEMVVDQKESKDGESWYYQKFDFRVTSGSLDGEVVRVTNGELGNVRTERYEEGDELIVGYGENLDDEEYFYVIDYVREKWLLGLLLVFVVVAVLTTKKWAVTSLVGMAFSFLVVFRVILPMIIDGFDPVWAAIGGSALIIPVTFYLSHGFSRKTNAAILGTVVSLILIGWLSKWLMEMAHLTGLASEEAGFFLIESGGGVDMKGILLAGIIIGSLGVLDDVTISQAAIVAELKKTDKGLRMKDLYKKAMRVGNDHITSMINTLVLVYTGAAMPLLLLFISGGLSFSEVINYEVVAEEIIRTLIGSIGLVLAVPITTVIAAKWMRKSG